MNFLYFLKNINFSNEKKYHPPERTDFLLKEKRFHAALKN